MKLRVASLFILLSLRVSVVGWAKDTPLAINQCPAPVQAVIRHYSAQGTFESVALDEKKKSGGTAIYEAKFGLPNGKRIEVHISSEGRVLQFEEKKTKN